MAPPPLATASFATQVKVVEDVLRPGGLEMTGQIPGTGIMLIANPGAGEGYTEIPPSRCKFVILEKVEETGMFRGSLLNSQGMPMLTAGMAEPPFDFALCVHSVEGASGGLNGIKSMGTFPPGTGALLVPVQVLLDNNALTHVSLPKWYFVASESEKGECALCGMHTVLGSDVPLHSCKMCKLPKYCSVTCQADDWRLGHSRICGDTLKVQFTMILTTHPIALFVFSFSVNPYTNELTQPFVTVHVPQRDAKKGHWSLKYSHRTDDLKCRHFPPYPGAGQHASRTVVSPTKARAAGQDTAIKFIKRIPSEVSFTESLELDPVRPTRLGPLHSDDSRYNP